MRVAKKVALLTVALLSFFSIPCIIPTQGHILFKPNSIEIGNMTSSNITYWSNENPKPQQLADNITIEGDQIMISAEFPDNHEDPNINVQSVSWIACRGSVVNRTGALVIPEGEYDPFLSRVVLNQFTWELVENIERGDDVRIDLYHSNPDTDVLVFWNDTNPFGWSSTTSIIGVSMATGNLHHESASFTAQRPGVLAIGIYCFDRQPGEYLLSVDTREFETGRVEGNSVKYDTWHWGKNVTLNLEFIGNTAIGLTRGLSVNRVTLMNFFSPVVQNIHIISRGDTKEITWDVFDRNRFEIHEYEVLISLDGGCFFQLIASGITTNYYSWNIAGYGRFDQCQIQVRACDDLGLIGFGYSPLFVVLSTDAMANGRWFAIVSSGNLTYIWGSSDNQVSWDIRSLDNVPLSYEVAIDDTVVASGWTSGGEILVDVDGLELGTHEAVLFIEVGQNSYNECLIIRVLPDASLYMRQFMMTFATAMILTSAIVTLELKRRL